MTTTAPADAASALLLTLDPAMTAHVRVTGDGVTIDLNGEEPALCRVLALALIASAIGDEDGPERMPGGRYALGSYLGVSILAQTAITDDEQRELEAFGRRMIDEIGGE